MSSASRNGELIGQKLGKYELLSLIAVGGTAEIYLARISGASGFEKYLVVKSLLDHLADNPEFVQMFLDESRISAQLDHSNIVQTLELGSHNGRYFLVMEYLAGMSVAQMARKTQERGINGGYIEPNLVLGMVSQTCNGLFYAHNKKVQGQEINLVHRDISPQNLVITFEGILKIVDFGIAKSDIRDSQTKTGTIKGKFAYMSPEQCLAKNIDHRTDIFALGTLCHELLTGRRLFKRQNTYDTYQAIISGTIPTPSSLNPKLDSDVDEVIMKALAYNREDRYQTAQEFGEAVLTLLHKRGGSAGPGEIARFLEAHFDEEITAHNTQMREFITGKVAAPVVDSTWDSEIVEVKASPVGRQANTRAMTTPQMPAARPLAAAPRSAPPRPAPPRSAPPRPAPPRSAPPRSAPPRSAPQSQAGAKPPLQSPGVSNRLGTTPATPSAKQRLPSILPTSTDLDTDADDDDEATRVEFNPADRVAQYHKEETGMTRAIGPRTTSDPEVDLPAIPTPGLVNTPGRTPAPSLENRKTAPIAEQKPLGGSGPKATRLGMTVPEPPPKKTTVHGIQQGTVPTPPPPLQAPAQQAAAMPLQAAPPPPVPQRGLVGMPMNPAPSQPYPAGQYSQPYPQMPNVPGVSWPQQFTAAVPHLPPPVAVQSNGTPAWQHAAVFLLFIGLGFGIAAIVKMIL